MSKIELKHIDKFYGKNHVLKDLNLTIEDGEFMTLLGPSGCGKTTTLRVISGLEDPQHGTIEMNGETIVDAEQMFFTPPAKRDLNLVFQSYALWPHMTVYGNVAFGMANTTRMSKAEIKKKVDSALERMQISQYAERYPSELSGGQQQRVAIARAIANEPSLLLLDEPLSNLDAKLRLDMRSEIKRLHEELGTTIVYVTHDQVEAMTMSTRVAIFFEGVLEQVATPNDIYTNPATLKVADFIGNPSINFVDGTAHLEDGDLVVDSAMGLLRFPGAHRTEEALPEGNFPVVLGVRPEHLAPAETGVDAKVYICQPAGSETLVQMYVGQTRMLMKLIGLKHFTRDQQIKLQFDPELITVYDKKSEKLIKRSIVKE